MRSAASWSMCDANVDMRAGSSPSSSPVALAGERPSRPWRPACGAQSVEPKRRRSSPSRNPARGAFQRIRTRRNRVPRRLGRRIGSLCFTVASARGDVHWELEQETSKLMCVDDEALMVAHFVIQGPTCLVGNLGLPVNAAATGGARRFVHSKNELTPDTKSPPILRGEEGLHV